MADPNKTVDQNLLPVQAYFAVDGSFQTFIGQGQSFTVPITGAQSGLIITNSTLDSSPIGSNSPSTGVFTNISTTTGTITTSPVNSTDIANKYYVDAVAQGLGPKAACQVGTTVNISLTGLQTIDTYTTLAGDRVLVKNQSTSSQNGIYIASASAWTRSTDMDVWSEVPGAYTVLLNGGQSNTGWVSTATQTGTIGVTAMPWVQFSANNTYYAGTGLTLASNTFSITNTGVTANTYGSATQTVTFVINAQGQITSATSQNIAIAATQITSGTIDSARISGSYTGITGVGTITAGTWNGSTIGVPYGGTGATTLTGYVYGNGTGAMSAATTIPTTSLNGTITNAQLANSTISGVALGGNLFTLTIGSNLGGTSYNGSSAVTITNSAPMVYPGSGIPNSTGTAWGTSYSVSGTGTVVPLATAATLNNPTISNYQAFTPTTAPTHVEGLVFYDSSAKTLNYYNENSEMSVNIGQEQFIRVRNQTGSQINDGSVVYINGATGNTPTIALAIATSFATADVVGVTTTNIANNGFGYVTTSGLVNGLNTSAFTDGQAVYLSPTVAGAYTATEPNSPNYSVQVGVIARANPSVGTLLVSVQFISVETSHIVGQVAIANGGTNGTATPTAGAIAYGSGTAYAFTSAGTSGQVLTSAGAGTPTWSAPTAVTTVTDDTTTNGTRYPLFANQTSGTITNEYTSSTKLQFNPSTGIFTATGFSGSGAGLTSIPNSGLVNSSITVGSTAISLGSSATTIAGLTSVTSTTFVGALTGNASSATTATTATNATNIAITDNTSTNANYYPVFVANSSGNNPATTSSTKLKYNPSTGALYVSAIYIAP